MKLVVGLGNPGKKYTGTRHNVGFEILEEVAARLLSGQSYSGQGSADQSVAGRKKQKFGAELAEVRFGGERCLLLWPQSFMNRSGGSVAEAVRFYKIESSDVLIVCDDFQLSLGRIRFRPRGSAGGQKGLADVMGRLGTQEICRLRFGVGPLPDPWDAVDFVLSRFNTNERKDINPTIGRATDAVIRWLEVGIDVCMNEFNAAIREE